MRILQINTEKGWRGGERQTLYALRGFQQLGLSVCLLCREDSELAKRAGTEGFKIEERAGFWSQLWFLISQGSGFDVIHSQTARGLTVAVLSKPFHGRPVVYSRRLDFEVKGWLSKWKYRQADALVAISEAIKVILLKAVQADITVIPDCLEPVAPDADRARTFLMNKGLKAPYLLGTTAALVPHKDPKTMIRAIAELAKTRNDFVFLHFGQGELMEEARRLIEELGIQETYYLLGYQDQVEDFVSVFSVFVMSSEEEGLGSSVLDAFYYQVPVVSTDAGGLKETVGPWGLLSPVHDSNGLAQNLDRMLNEKDLPEWESIRAKAKAFIEQRHSLQPIHQAYLEVFSRLLKRG